MSRIASIFLLASAAVAIASSAFVGTRPYHVRDGANYTVYEDVASGATLSFVTNSGVCETTPGVNQYSGYISVGNNMVSQSSLCKCAI